MDRMNGVVSVYMQIMFFFCEISEIIIIKKGMMWEVKHMGVVHIMIFFSWFKIYFFCVCIYIFGGCHTNKITHVPNIWYEYLKYANIYCMEFILHEEIYKGKLKMCNGSGVKEFERWEKKNMEKVVQLESFT